MRRVNSEGVPNGFGHGERTAGQETYVSWRCKFCHKSAITLIISSQQAAITIRWESRDGRREERKFVTPPREGRESEWGTFENPHGKEKERSGTMRNSSVSSVLEELLVLCKSELRAGGVNRLFYYYHPSIYRIPLPQRNQQPNK